MEEELLQLEGQGWQALSMDQSRAHEFWTSALREDVVMLFQDGALRLLGKDQILVSLAVQPWRKFNRDDSQAVILNNNVRSFTRAFSGRPAPT